LQKVMRDDDGVFFFKFTSLTGLEQVLEKGPWMIRNQPLILTKWEPNLSVSNDEVTKVLLWVKVHKGRIGYAWALIEVEADNMLKEEITMAVPLVDGTGHSRVCMYVEYE
ncbi:retrovirus-related pol polyprotein from transposon TNT 1-94, partial [Tanacetum coccineum]